MKESRIINIKQNLILMIKNNKFIAGLLILVGVISLNIILTTIFININNLKVSPQEYESNFIDLSSNEDFSKVIKLNLGDKGNANEILTLLRSSGFGNVLLTSRIEEDRGYERFPQTIYIVNNSFSLDSLKKVHEIDDGNPSFISDIQRITESGKFSNYWYATREVYDDIIIFKNDGELISDSVCQNNQDVLKYHLCLYDYYDRDEEVIHIYNINNPTLEWEKVKIDPETGGVVR